MKLMAPTVRVLIVDDHAMFREGLTELLNESAGVLVTGQCASSAEAIAMLSLSRPSVVLLDFDLGTERALTFLDQARAAGFTGRVLILTAGVSEFEAIQLIQAGVSGIFHKHNSKDMLCETIQRVAAGEVCLEKCYMKHVFRTIDQTQSGVISLTGRDKSILHMVFQGLSNKEIGIQLDLSEGTVKAAVRQLFHKFGVHTRAQMVKVALEEYADQL